MGDFSCICNYDVEKPVYGQMSASSTPIGYLYEFDCKPEGLETGNTAWFSIQYEGQYGYLEAGPNAMKQVCPGVPPDSDTVRTTTKPTTVVSTKTPTSTTSIAQSTSTTPKIPTLTSSTITPATSTTTRSTTTATTPITSTSTKPTTTTTPTPKPTTSKATTRSTTTIPTTTSTTTTPSTTSTSAIQTTTSTKPPTTISTTSRPTPTTTWSNTPPETTRQTTSGPQTVFDGCGPFRPIANSNEPGVLFTILASANTCYEFVSFPQHSWRSAESHCTANNGHLVHIANKQEQDGIYSFVHSKGGHGVWIGLNDIIIEEIFTWVSGDPVTITNWQNGRFAAFGHNTEDCVVLTDQTHNGTWDDRPCSEFHGFVCEYVTGTKTSASTTMSSTRSRTTFLTSMASHSGAYTFMYGCTNKANVAGDYEPGTRFTIDNRCYELVRAAHTWRVAENHCVNKGGHLASIDNTRQQNGVYQVVKGSSLGNVWIGLHNHDIDGHYSWISGSVAGFTHFSTANSSFQNSQDKDCVILEGATGLWLPLLCSEAHPYLCEIESNSATTRPTTVVPVWHSTTQHTAQYTDGDTTLCPFDVRREAQQFGTPLAQRDSRCYEIITRSVTWAYGETLCKVKGGHLADILSAEEQDYIVSFITRHGSPDVWIGLNDIHAEGVREWTSGNPVTYTHWQSDHVANVANPGLEDCVLMRSSMHGAWDDVPCDSYFAWGGATVQKHNVLCEYGTIIAGHMPDPIG